MSTLRTPHRRTTPRANFLKLSLVALAVASPMTWAQTTEVEPKTTSSQDAQLMPAVTVSAAPLTEKTEHSGAYIKPITKTATKLNLAPRDTPQIVHSITRQVLDDFAVQDIEGALRLTPGVVISHTDDDRRGYTSRGYSMAVQYDGLPSTSGIDGGVVAGPDAALLDSTEVLLGASGLMNGAGLPGGVVNMNYKQPTTNFQAEGSLSFGSWDMNRQVIDVSGPLTESGKLRARMISVSQSEESFRDYAGEKKKVFYAVVDSDLGDSTLLSLSIQKQDIYDNVTDRSGLPADNNKQDLNWDRSSFLAPAWNRWNKYATTYKARLEQLLFDDWKLTIQGSMLESEADWLFGTLSKFDSTTGNGTFSRWAQYNKETSDDLELYLTGSFQLFGRKHELVAGGNWTKRIWNGKGGDGAPYTTNLYQFDPETSIPQPEIILNKPISDQLTKQYGSYLAGRFSLADDLKAILGSRVSWYQYQYLQTDRNETGVVTPYAGLIYDLNDWLSAYSSYSDMFNPQSNKSPDGRTLDPEIGANYEIGLKGEFYDGKLNTAVALFKIEKTNEAKQIASIPYDANNICGGYCYEAQGETVTKGFDLGASGEVTDKLKLMAGFTQYKKDDNHKTVRIAKLSSSYTPIEHWSFGGSIDSSNKSYGSYGMAQDARTLVGIFGKHQLNKHLEVALNINNLFDKAYYANSIDSGYGRQYWGEPRSWELSLNGKY